MFSGGERVQYTYSLGRMVKMVKRKIDHLIKYLLKLFLAEFFSLAMTNSILGKI